MKENGKMENFRVKKWKEVGNFILLVLHFHFTICEKYFYYVECMQIWKCNS